MSEPSSPFHAAPEARETVPAPSSRDEARLALKLERDKARKLQAALAEPEVRAWMAAQAGKDS